MAVIAELIDVGLKLRQAGNLQGAIEHFRQLRATYPDNARVMFELGACWRAFGVPEQALPLFRALLEKPKGQGLPPKDMPRLYAQLAAATHAMGEYAEALAIVDAGLRAHPSYRPLRAWRIFALRGAGSQSEALLDALELMLGSLAPSRWDIFEEDIIAVVKELRAEIHPAPAAEPSEKEAPRRAQPSALQRILQAKPEAKKPPPQDSPPQPQTPAQIALADDQAEPDEFEVAVRVKPPAPRKPPRPRKPAPSAQLGKRSVRIDIGNVGEDESDDKGDDEASASFKIPLDSD